VGLSVSMSGVREKEGDEEKEMMLAASIAPTSLSMDRRLVIIVRSGLGGGLMLSTMEYKPLRDLLLEYEFLK
jgi:hypothetical protein